MKFSWREREANLERLAAEPFDVLVVGGGITGVGVALDAAGRGLRTALLERDDFASGTSSRSSKLVHGGLRYLNQREFRLVYEALHERQRLLRLAPHLVRPLPFLIPVFGAGAAGQAGARAYARAIQAALWMYDATGGARIGKLHRRLSRDETLERMPDLDAARLAAGFLYYDARVDDARLTLAVAKTAAGHGAVVANRVEVSGFVRRNGGRVAGVVAADRVTGRRFEVSAAVVVNAAGVWSDDVRALDEGANPGSIRPAKGVHITLPRGRPRLDTAAVLPVPRDRRSVFVIPWGERVYVGTTDTDYTGSRDEPLCTAADVDYLLGAVNAWLSDPISPDEVLGTWAGLRPLVGGAASGKTSDLSRRHSVLVGDSGLVTIVGGKLTTYRKMAQDAVDAAARVLGRERARGAGRSRTDAIPIFGADGFLDLSGPDGAARLGLDPATADHLVGRHGGHARAVAAIIHEHADLGRALVPGLPYLRAEAVYAARYEMALTLEDVLSRRTRSLLLDAAATAAAASDVADLLAPELGWDASETTRQVEALRALVARQRRAGDPAAGVLGDPAEVAVEARLLVSDEGPGPAGSPEPGQRPGLGWGPDRGRGPASGPGARG